MIEFLDRRLSSVEATGHADVSRLIQSHQLSLNRTQPPLPEFIASGGGTGIFKRPSLMVRSAYVEEERSKLGGLYGILSVLKKRGQMRAGPECGLWAWDLSFMQGICGQGLKVV